MTIGIDFGITHSRVGIFCEDNIEIFANELGNQQTPTIISFTDNGILIGEQAKNQITINPSNTIYDIKLILGQQYTDPSFQKRIPNYPFKILQSKYDSPIIEVNYKGETKQFYIEEIAGMYLKELKKLAEKRINEKVTKAIISVPQNYYDSQLRATVNSAKIAGFEEVELIDDITAACLSFLFRKKLEGERFVFSLSGISFDLSITIMDYSSPDCIYVESKATSGKMKFGGRDIDDTILSYFISRVQKKLNIDITKYPSSLAKLRIACEKAKIELSTTDKTTIFCESLFEGQDFSDDLNRPLFESLMFDFFRKIERHIEKILNSDNIDMNNITDVLILGGSSKIPKIQNLIQKFFVGKQIHTELLENDFSVIEGIILKAGQEDPKTNSELVKNIFNIPICPYAFKIFHFCDQTYPRILKFSPLPIKAEWVISTFYDNQTEIDVEVYVGNEKSVKKSKLLNVFKIIGISPRERCKPQIQYIFDVDANGIFSFFAKEKLEDGSIEIYSTKRTIDILPDDLVEKMKIDCLV